MQKAQPAFMIWKKHKQSHCTASATIIPVFTPTQMSFCAEDGKATCATSVCQWMGGLKVKGE